jgi:hypothetical protein
MGLTREMGLKTRCARRCKMFVELVSKMYVAKIALIVLWWLQDEDLRLKVIDSWELVMASLVAATDICNLYR